MTATATEAPKTAEGTGTETGTDVAKDKATSKNYRNYVVLRKNDAKTSDDLEETYVKVGVYWASDDQQAVRQVVAEHGLAEYVAVAEGSWHVRKPRSEPQPDRIRF